MTMLDTMRRHKGWLKWSLAVVVLTFILLYIPSFLRDSSLGAAPTDAIAVIEGRKVTVGEYQRAYTAQVNQIRQSYGENLTDDMLKQFGIAQRVVQQLIDGRAVLAEADRLGITVTDSELKERILRFPGFQENGRFIGDARYRQLLRMQRPPMTPAEFEEGLRDQLIAEKLQAAVTDWLRVTDAEVDQEYKQRNEKVKLELAVFTADQFRKDIQPTDAEVQAHFKGREETYRVGEKRRVRFLSIDGDALRTKMTATPQEIEARYKQNLPTYTTPEQVRASHILLKTADKDGKPKDDAAVKKEAESVLAKVKAKGDFAALAKQYSEDEGSKEKGGDLDFFGKGAMVKEFDEAAWSMEPGQISDLVKTNFGYHIIKLVNKRPGSTRTLEDVRQQLEEQIKYEKAQAEASKVAEEVAKEIDDPGDLDRVAQARGLKVGDSGLFAREEPLMGLGFAPTVAAEAFTLEQGKVSGQLRTNQGAAFITVVEIKPAYVPTLEEVKTKVRDDVIRTKAVELARTKAETMAQAAKSNFAAAAKAAGVQVKTTELISRGQALPDVGVSNAVDAAVFALRTGETSSPIATDNAVVVARVKERQDPKSDTLAADRLAIQRELVDQRRMEFFGAYMAKAKAKMKVTFNDNALKSITGS